MCGWPPLEVKPCRISISRRIEACCWAWAVYWSWGMTLTATARPVSRSVPLCTVPAAHAATVQPTVLSLNGSIGRTGGALADLLPDREPRLVGLGRGGAVRAVAFLALGPMPAPARKNVSLCSSERIIDEMGTHRGLLSPAPCLFLSQPTTLLGRTIPGRFMAWLPQTTLARFAPGRSRSPRRRSAARSWAWLFL